MKRVDEFIPWKVTDISLRPYSNFYSMNPSIHFDGVLWRCVIRCADYCLPGGREIKSIKAKPGESRTKNAMVIFDPTIWKPIEIYKMKEHDDLPRAPSSSIGYEDIRIFRTDWHGLQGIAAALHLRRTDRIGQLAEQVLLWFDDEYNIVDARPIRGAWSSTANKNWAPFDHCAEPRFLAAIDEGALFDVNGEVRGDEAQVLPSKRPRRSHLLGARTVARAQERARGAERDRAREDRLSSTPSGDAAQSDEEPLGVLRGGTQLVLVGEDTWLGIGHAMRFVDGLKFYAHVWYLTDSCGKMKASSPPMKLAPEKIEFAAGLAIDGERVVVSFGVDDIECRLGETKLSSVLEMLQPIEKQT